MIKIENLCKYYQTKTTLVKALENVSLEISPGELVGIKGPSGSGKTTLLFSIGGLLYPSSGKVLVNGKDIYRLDPKHRADFRAGQIGFVFQQFHLIPYLTVLENIAVPLLADSGRNDISRAMELIERFNLSQRIAHKPSELSTGERQRTTLARALFNNPKVILADEPTGNLDSDNAAVVIETLHDLAKSGCSVVVASHDNLWDKHDARTINLSNGSIQEK